jgi:monoterpene epsilon-lactone hydrolase
VHDRLPAERKLYVTAHGDFSLGIRTFSASIIILLRGFPEAVSTRLDAVPRIGPDRRASGALVGDAPASTGGRAPGGGSPCFDTRAEAELYFTKSQAAGLVRSYLGVTDPKNPLASPLYGDLNGLPPIRIHVGDDEVLLDDSRRYVERAVGAGVDAKVDIWMGMPHGFVTNVGGFNAATQALKASGAFLIERMRS